MKRYRLCSSVIYVPYLKKHVVIFQAVIGGTESKYFKRYFEMFFDHFNIDFDHFVGVIMDFSNAQSGGFMEAYQTKKKYSGEQVSDKYDGLQFLKGCLYHWMQSVRRIAQKHDVV
jgi:hypothetical protein